MVKSRTRMPSPARSLGITQPPRLVCTRATRSVGSPARSDTSPRHSTTVGDAPSLLSWTQGNKQSILSDNTQVEMPKRRSWYRKLGDNTTDMQAMLGGDSEDNTLPFEQIAEANIVVSNQQFKNSALDIMEESNYDSFGSIYVPQRKLRGNRQTQSANKFENIPSQRDSLEVTKKCDEDKTLTVESTVTVAKKDLFAKNKGKEIQYNYPQLLDNVTSNTTGKRVDNTMAIEAGMTKKTLFGRRPKTNEQSAFTNFVMSEDEEDTTQFQGRVMTFGKSVKSMSRGRRISSTSKSSKQPSSSESSVVSEQHYADSLDFDSWKLLFSSTKVGEDLAIGQKTPVKQLRSTSSDDDKKIRNNEKENRFIQSDFPEQLNQEAVQIEDNCDSRSKNKSKNELTNDSKRLKLNATENMNIVRPSNVQYINRESDNHSKNSTGVRSFSEGSGWDSHTTHIQKFGELTMQNRKSLRAMVLSKAANTRVSTKITVNKGNLEKENTFVDQNYLEKENTFVDQNNLEKENTFVDQNDLEKENTFVDQNNLEKENTFVDQNNLEKENTFVEQNNLEKENTFVDQNNLEKENTFVDQNNLEKENTFVDQNNLEKENTFVDQNNLEKENTFVDQNNLEKENTFVDQNNLEKENTFVDQNNLEKENTFVDQNNLEKENNFVDQNNLEKENTFVDQNNLEKENTFVDQNNLEKENTFVDQNNLERERNVTTLPDVNVQDFSMSLDNDNTFAHPSMNRFGKHTTMEKYYIQKIREENVLQKEKIQQKVMGSIVTCTSDVNHEADIARNIKWNNFKKPKTPAPRKMKETGQPVENHVQFKAPKLFKPPRAEWVTKRLYKYLETKLTPKYRLNARIRSERFVRLLFEVNKELMNIHITREIQIIRIKLLQKEMAHLHLVNSYFEFYDFVEEFMPKEFRMKVIPDVFNRLPQPSRGIYSEIVRAKRS